MALVVSLVTETDPRGLVLFFLMALCIIIVLAFTVLIAFRARRCLALDPYAVSHGDVPGFTPEQLRRFHDSQTDEMRI